MNEKIIKIGKEIEPYLINLRRELHQYPEIALNEKKTANIIASELKKIPHLTVYENMAEGTGVVAVLEGKKGPGKCIMIRADIDALPIEEELESEWKSKNKGFMHACGHDAHITWVIGTAMILSNLVDDLSGSVKFVFQPGEEYGKGAKALVEKDKILENPKVDAVFAGHVWPSIPAGEIGIAQKYAFGCPGGFTVKIKGAGGHGSWPYECVNPISVANQIYNGFQRIITERITSTEPRVISVGSIHAGKEGVGNIIPDECIMNGTIRAVKTSIMEDLIKEMKRTVDGIALLNNVECEFSAEIFQKAVENNKELVNHTKRCAQEIIGKDKCYILEEANLGGENFSEYSSRVPGCYIFAGVKDKNQKSTMSLHSSNFKIAEEVLAKTAMVFANTILLF